ncbi:MAG TPA: hypothetical protein VK158_01115 [Acidobacteriota bacterium]|nr:hypothetical protein [Acidobacteriota bacterium]
MGYSMLSIPYESVLTFLSTKTGIQKPELEFRIQQKLNEFSGLISKEGAAHIIANELGISLLEAATTITPMNQIKPGMKQITILAKVLDRYEPITFNKNGKTGKVASALLGDETASMRLTFWHDDVDMHSTLVKNEIVRITNLTAKENQGRTELSYSSSSRIEHNPNDAPQMLQNVSAQTQAPRIIQAPYKKISDLQATDGTVSVLGTIVQVFKPAQYVLEKKTGKKIRLESEPNPDLHEVRFILNFILDDGTESIRVVAFGNDALTVAQTSAQELALMKTDEASFNHLKTSMLGKIVKIIGRVSKNEMYNRTELILRSIDLEPDPQAELARLKEITE